MYELFLALFILTSYSVADVPDQNVVISILFQPLIKQETCSSVDGIESCYIEPGSFITTPFSMILGFTIIAIVLYLDYRADGKIDGSFKKLEKR